MPVRTATGMAELAAEVKAIGRRAGLAEVGIAPAAPFERARRVIEARKDEGLHGGMHFTFGRPERSTDPGQSLPGARALVVGARSYLLDDPPTATPAAPAEPATPLARVARYSWRDHYAPLRTALGHVARHLADHGWRTKVLADDNALVDREAAYLAGLGWYGKNTNILLPGRGSWFVLGAVVTDAPLLPATGPVADGCGECRRCLTACPTGALTSSNQLDARRCLAWLLEAPGLFPREFRRALGDRIYGCDDCQTVCPPNRTAGRRHPPPPAEAAADEPYVDLLAMLAASDEELLDRYGRWYIPKRQARYLRRNALVALGNTADGQDPRVGDALARALADVDPIVRAHAVWAAAELGRADLLPTSDPDVDVQAELDAAAAEAAAVPTR